MGLRIGVLGLWFSVYGLSSREPIFKEYNALTACKTFFSKPTLVARATKSFSYFANAVCERRGRCSDPWALCVWCMYIGMCAFVWVVSIMPDLEEMYADCDLT